MWRRCVRVDRTTHSCDGTDERERRTGSERPRGERTVTSVRYHPRRLQMSVALPMKAHENRNCDRTHRRRRRGGARDGEVGRGDAPPRSRGPHPHRRTRSRRSREHRAPDARLLPPGDAARAGRRVLRPAGRRGRVDRSAPSRRSDDRARRDAVARRCTDRGPRDPELDHPAVSPDDGDGAEACHRTDRRSPRSPTTTTSTGSAATATPPATPACARSSTSASRPTYPT